MSVTPQSRPARAGKKSPLSDRRVAFVGAAAAAALAGTLLVVGTSDDPTSTPAPTVVPKTNVIVAGTAIRQGAALDAGAVASGLKVRSVPATDAQAGAIASVDALAGKVATRDISPGQQITATAVKGDDGAIQGKLTGWHRGITVPIDPINGMKGEVTTGDHIDLYASFKVAVKKGSTEQVPVLRLLATDVPVLRAPARTGADVKATDGSDADSGGDGSGAAGQITLDLTSKVAQRVAFIADSGKLWVAARPASGAPAEKPSLVTLDTLLQGVKPMVVDSKGAQK